MKLELNLVRMTNEDVIVTSTCNHLTSNHIHVTSYDANYQMYDWTYYKYNNGKLAYDGTDGGGLTGVNSTGWYYTTDGQNYYKCDNQSDAAHPVKP